MVFGECDMKNMGIPWRVSTCTWTWSRLSLSRLARPPCLAARFPRLSCRQVNVKTDVVRIVATEVLHIEMASQLATIR